MSEYNDIVESNNKKERGNWVDDFSQIGETLTGLAGVVLPFFGKQPTNTNTNTNTNTDFFEDDENTGSGATGGTPPPERPRTGRIILFSTLGLAVVGTVVYFIVKKRKQ